MAGIRVPSTGDNRGIALVLTLLAVAIITAMVAEFSYDVYVSTSSLYNWQNAQKLSLAARSAVRLGSGLITEMIATDHYNPGVFEMSQKIPFADVDGTVALRIEDENSKFNLKTLVNQNGSLNREAYDSLVRLLAALQLKTELADRIIYWINPFLEPELKSPENLSKGSDPDSIDELLLVPGMDARSYERLRPYVTIYGNGSININGADIPVLLSLSSSIDEGMAENIIRYRKDTPFMRATDILKVMGFDNAVGISLSTGHTNMKEASPAVISTQGTAFSVIATAQSGKLKRIIDSVIDISGGGRTVLYWKEM
jgi:general secretion pathway protein K